MKLTAVVPLILVLASSSAALWSGAAVAALALGHLRATAPIKNRPLFPHEARNYIHSDRERAPLVLDQDAEGHLIYEQSRIVFKSQGTEAADYGGEHPFITNRALLVVSAQGQLIAFKKSEPGRYHHSTAIGGEDALFGGQIETSAPGAVTYIDYSTGHYTHGPYRLKLLLQVLHGTQRFPDARVGLSDVFEKHPELTVAEFDHYCLQPEDTGQDVILRYLAATRAVRTRGAAEQALRAVFYELTSESTMPALAASMGEPDLLKALAHWVQLNTDTDDEAAAGWIVELLGKTVKTFRPTRDADRARRFIELITPTLPVLAKDLEALIPSP